MHQTDQVLQDASPPKDHKPPQTSPMFSFTDPRHSHAFVLRMRNARPDPSQFKIKLFKVEMDIPGVEEALNPENPLGHMERVGLSLAAMSFLSPNKCKVEENQKQRLQKDKGNPELNEKVQLGLSQGNHQQMNELQEKGIFSNQQKMEIQEKSNQLKQIPLQLSGHGLTQSELNSTQGQQNCEEFYSPSEYRRKMQEKIIQNEHSLVDNKESDDQRSSFLTQTDQRTSFFSQTDQRASQQVQNFQRTSFLSENEQQKNMQNQQNENKKAKQSEQSTEILIEPENTRKSSLRLSFDNDQSSWTSPVAFSAKQPHQKILKEPFGSMLLPGEGAEDIFDERGEEEEERCLPQEKSYLNKHRKNNYSIDTPSFRHTSHTTPILQLNFSESMYTPKAQDISTNIERQDIFQEKKNCFSDNNSDSYLKSQNVDNLISSNKKYDETLLKQDLIGQQEQKIDYLNKSDRIPGIKPENQQISQHDNKYQIYDNKIGLPNANGSNQSTLNDKQNNNSSILNQQNTSLPLSQYQQQSQQIQTNNVSYSNNFQTNILTPNIHENGTDYLNTKSIDIKGNDNASNDKPQFDKMDQIINDCLKHTSALFEQIKQDQIQRAQADLHDAKQKQEFQQNVNYQVSNQISGTSSYQDPRLLSQFPGNYSSSQLNDYKVKTGNANYQSETHPLAQQQQAQAISNENPKHYLNTSQSYQSNYLRDNLRQQQPSYETAQKIQPGNYGQKNLGTLESNNPFIYSASEQKQTTYQDRQNYKKTINRDTGFQSNNRGLSHLSASVDYSLTYKQPQSIPQSYLNKPAYVYDDIQGSGQSNSQINKQLSMNHDKLPGLSFPWKKIHHSVSPQKQSFSTNLEEIASSSNNTHYQPNIQDHKFTQLSQNQDKYISPSKLTFPQNNNSSSTNTDIQKYHKKYPSSNVPQQVQNEITRENNNPSNKLFQNLIYEGSIDELNRKQGFGILRLKNSQEIIYQGFWKNNIFEGEGMIKNIYEQPLLGNFNYLDLSQVGSQWKCYEGQFSNGLRQGKGVLTLSNLEKFAGIFEKDIANGQGIFYRKDASPIFGYWIDNKFKQEQ